jgi:nitrile hydratase accessory protein
VGGAGGIAVALSEGGRYDWQAFSRALTEEIAGAEGAGEGSTYYERWLRALERLALEKGLLTGAEVASRREQEAREHDHEHDA